MSKKVVPGLSLSEQGLKQCCRCFQPIDLDRKDCPICKALQGPMVPPKPAGRVPMRRQRSAENVTSDEKADPKPSIATTGNASTDALALSPRGGNGARQKGKGKGKDKSGKGGRGPLRLSLKKKNNDKVDKGKAEKGKGKSKGASTGASSDSPSDDNTTTAKAKASNKTATTTAAAAKTNNSNNSNNSNTNTNSDANDDNPNAAGAGGKGKDKESGGSGVARKLRKMLSGSSNSNAPLLKDDNPGPLQRDTEQQKLVDAAVRAKSEIVDPDAPPAGKASASKSRPKSVRRAKKEPSVEAMNTNAEDPEAEQAAAPKKKGLFGGSKKDKKNAPDANNDGEEAPKKKGLFGGSKKEKADGEDAPKKKGLFVKREKHPKTEVVPLEEGNGAAESPAKAETQQAESNNHENDNNAAKSAQETDSTAKDPTAQSADSRPNSPPARPISEIRDSDDDGGDGDDDGDDNEKSGNKRTDDDGDDDDDDVKGKGEAKEGKAPTMQAPAAEDDGEPLPKAERRKSKFGMLSPRNRGDKKKGRWATFKGLFVRKSDASGAGHKSEKPKRKGGRLEIFRRKFVDRPDRPSRADIKAELEAPVGGASVYCGDCGKENPAENTECQACHAELDKNAPSSPRRANAGDSAPAVQNEEPAAAETEKEKPQHTATAGDSQQNSNQQAAAAPVDPEAPAPLAHDPAAAHVFGEGIQDGLQAAKKINFFVELYDNRGERWLRSERVKVEVIAPNNKKVRSSTKNLKQGKYQVTYTRALPGIYTITIRTNGINAASSPYRVKSLQRIEPTKCSASGRGLDDSTQSSIPVFFMIETRDIAGERVTEGGRDVAVNITCDGEPVKFDMADQGDGTYRVEYVQAKHGNYKALVLVEGGAVAGSPFEFVVKQSADPKSTTLDGKGLLDGDQSEVPTTFDVHVKDTSGAPCLDAPGLHVTCTDPNKDDLPVDIKDQGNGTYRVYYVRKVHGVYRIDVRLNGEPVGDSPYRCQAAQVVEPRKTLLDGPGLEGGVQSPNPVYFNAQLCDAAGTRMRNVTDVPIEVTIDGPEGPVEPKVSDRDDGSWRVHFTREVAGEYSVLVKVQDKVAGEGPRKVQVAQQLDVDSVRLEGEGLEAGVQAKEPTTFKLSATDIAGRPISGVAWNVTVEDPSSATHDAKVVDHDDGTYTASYDRRLHGRYTLAIKHEGQHIAASPYLIVVDQLMDPSQADVEGAGIEDGGQSKEATSFVVQCRDMAGDRMLRGGDELSVKIEGPGGDAVDVDVQDNEDGSYRVSYVRHAAGTYRVELQLNDAACAKSPYSIQVSAEADPTAVRAHGEGLEDGKQGLSCQFELECKDLAGDPLSNQEFDIAIEDGQGEEVATEVKDSGDGKYVVSYDRKTAGTYQVSVKLKGRHIAASPYRCVVEQLLNIGGTLVSGDGIEDGVQSADGTSFLVQLVDLAGSRMRRGGDQVDVKVIGPKHDDDDADDGKVEAQVEDNGDGSYTCSLVRKYAGTYRVEIVVNDTPLDASPFEVRVSQVCNANRVEVMGEALQDGQQALEEQEVFIRSFDIADEPMESGEQNFTVEVTGPEGILSPGVTDNADGTYLASFVRDIAGNYTVHVLLNGRDVQGSPWDARVSQVGSPTLSKASGPGLSDGKQSVEPVEFFVEARDLLGRPFLGTDEEFGLDVAIRSPEGDECDLEIVMEGDGKFLIGYIPKQHGAYKVAVKCGRRHIGESPYRVAYEQVCDYAQFDVIGPGISKGLQSLEPVEVFVQARDVNGAEMAQGGLELQASVKGPHGDEKTVVVDNGDGAYQISYLRRYAGKYHVTLQLADGTALGASPYTCMVARVPDPAQCIVAGEGLDNGIVARKVSQFTIALHDINGEAMVRGVGDKNVLVKCMGGRKGEIAGEVKNNRNGTYTISWEPDRSGTYEVHVLLRLPDGSTAHMGESPFSVEVEKPPSAGSRWQEKFQEESAARKAQRERERLAEIEEAKKKFKEHADMAVKNALSKEQQQLAEEERQRKIKEHMEEVRETEKGQEIRQKVLQKLAEKAADDIYEPLEEGEEASSTGKAWAIQNRKEQEERRAQREAERQAEIEEAKKNYLEHAEKSKETAAQKEARQLAEEERQRKIKEHQKRVAQERGEFGKRGDAEEGEGIEVPDNEGKVLTYEEIKGKKASFLTNEEYDAQHLEAYLADDEFQEVLGMSKKDFYALSEWKREAKLKEKDLF